MLSQAKAHLLFISNGKIGEGHWLLSHGTKEATDLGLLETGLSKQSVLGIFLLLAEVKYW